LTASPNLACPDWFERLRAGRPPIPDLALNEAEANHAVAIFDRLRLPDVPGQPTMAEAAADWNRAIVRAVFGSVRTDGHGLVTGRTIRKFFELVPKKNAKTTSGAAIMLTALLKNRRPRAEFLLIGPTQIISDLAFSQAAGMIEADPEGFLQNRFQVQEHKKTIIDRTNKARLVIKTFDNKVVTGSKPVGVLIDELHELGKFAYAEKVLTQIRGGIIANPEGFLIYITTQSDEPPKGVFKAELDYARAIRDGSASGDMLPILYEFPVGMQEATAEQRSDSSEPWRDRSLWPLVLPNLGRSIAIETLDREFREAEAKGVESLALWASQHLNIEIGIALNRDRWAGAKYWLGRRYPQPLTVETLIDRCEVMVAGVDGGGLDDLTGVCLAGRETGSERWLFWFHAWAHPDVLEQRKEIAGSLRQFEADGDMTICASPTQDVDDVAELFARVHDAGRFPEKGAIGLDPVGVAALIDGMTARGIPIECMAPIGQGYRLSGAIKGFARRLKDGRAWHDGSNLMTWVVGNARIEVVGGADRMTKQVAGKAKIDPLIAGMNAFELLSRNPQVVSRNSVYRKRGIVIV
jgi:phage terminase large subunit-like protein